MKVILNQTVPKVGKEGQVVVVADGFARNYLFPRKLAILADKKQLQVLERKIARTEAKAAGDKAGAEGLKETLNGQIVRIPGKVGGDSSKLFGAITSQDIAEALKAQLKVSVDRKQIALIDPIKRLGNYEVELDLHRQVDAKITVQVYDPNAIVKEEAVAPAEELEPVEA
jgi:large subunit ribosomal protein L9